jgi:uncharacterized protein YbjQ (UPF0145 family)
MFGSKKEEKSSKPIPVVTTDSFLGRTVEYVGTVTSSNTKAGTGSIRDLVTALGDHAAELGADAVVGMKITAASGMKGTMTVYGIGTAVKFAD